MSVRRPIMTMPRRRINKKKRLSFVRISSVSGTTRNRTGDTRIFSPLLYQLSYGTIYAIRGVES